MYIWMYDDIYTNNESYVQEIKHSCLMDKINVLKEENKSNDKILVLMCMILHIIVFTLTLFIIR